MEIKILMDTEFTRVIKIQDKVFKLIYINECHTNGTIKYIFTIDTLLPNNTWERVATHLDTDYKPGKGTWAVGEKAKDQEQYYESMISYIKKVFLVDTETEDKKYTNIPISGILLEIDREIGKITLDNNWTYDFGSLSLTMIKNIHSDESYNDIFIHNGMQLSDSGYLAHTTNNGIRLGHTELILNEASSLQKNKLLTMIASIADGAKLVNWENQ
jgi:hypothetical protein